MSPIGELVDRIRQWLAASRRNQLLAAGATFATLVTLATVGVVVAVSGDGDSDTLVAQTATPTPQATRAPPAPTRESTAELTVEPTATAAAPSETGGFDGFRAFAKQIEVALFGRNAQFFIERTRIVEMTCEGEAELGPCAGKPPGTLLRGIPGSVSESDGSAIFSAEEYEQSLRRYFGAAREELSDEYGSGSLAVYALAQKERGGEQVFFAIATAIVDIYPTGAPIGNSEREAHAFNFSFLGDRWQFAGETVAVVSGSSYHWLSGESPSYYDQWERWEGPSP